MGSTSTSGSQSRNVLSRRPPRPLPSANGWIVATIDHAQRATKLFQRITSAPSRGLDCRELQALLTMIAACRIVGPTPP